MKKQKCRFIFGKSATDLDEKSIEFIKSDVENPNVEKILVISDDKHKKEFEMKIRKENIIDPNLKLNIGTFNDLLKREFTVHGDKRLNLLSGEQVNVLLLHLLYTNRSKLKTYKIIDLGLIKKFAKTIELLKENGISPNDLHSELAGKDNILKDKLYDLSLIYTEYEAFKKNRYLDIYDQLEYYSELVKNDTAYNHIYLYKMTDITNAELRTIKNIKKEQLNLIFDTDKVDRIPCNESAHFYKIDYIIQKIIHEFQLDIADIEKIQLDTTNCIKHELTHLADELYKYPHNVFNDETEQLFFTEADSILNEVEVLIETLQVVKNTNQNISIAVANIEEYGDVIKREFLNNGISFNMDTTLTLNTQPIYRILNLLLDSKESLTLCNFIQMLKTDYFNVEISDIYVFERYLESNELLNDTSFDNVDKDELVTLNDLSSIVSLFKQIKGLTYDLNKNETFKNYTKEIFDFFISNDILSKMQNDINDEVKNEGSSLTKASWENLISKFNLCSNILPDEEIEVEEFELILSTILQGVLQIKSKKGEGVNIVNTDSLQYCDIAFIIGADKGSIQSISNNTLLTDGDILKLNEFNLLIGEDCISKSLALQYDIYSMLTKAKNKLFISCSTKGLDLAKKEKAPFINRLQSIFSNLNNHSTYCTNMVHNGTSSTISDLLKFIRENFNYDNCDTYIEKIQSISNEEYSAEIKSIISALNYKNKAVCTDKYSLQDLYYSDFLSVSKLEKYAKCPFSYFLEYGLKLKKTEKLSLQAKHIGIALHGIIEDFDKRLKKQKITWEDITDEFIAIQVDDIISKFEKLYILKPFYTTPSSTYYLNRMRELAISSIKAIKSHIGGSFFEIDAHEIDFNDYGKYPAIPIKLSNGKRLKLQGQIDRLDLLKTSNADYIRIVDYKTGNTSLDFTEVAHGTQLQLLTYLDAILRSDDRYSPAGVFYFKVDDPYIKTTPNVLDSYIAESRQKEMKLNGLFINDEDVLKSMDKGIFDGDYTTSINIKARFKTDGSLSKSTPGITETDLNILREFTKSNIEDLATKMLVDCNIDINPIKKKAIIPCTYCNYKDVCHFDDTLEVNKFKILNEVSKDELIKLAHKKVGSENE